MQHIVYVVVGETAADVKSKAYPHVISHVDCLIPSSRKTAEEIRNGRFYGQHFDQILCAATLAARQTAAILSGKDPNDVMMLAPLNPRNSIYDHFKGALARMSPSPVEQYFDPSCTSDAERHEALSECEETCRSIERYFAPSGSTLVVGYPDHVILLAMARATSGRSAAQGASNLKMYGEMVFEPCHGIELFTKDNGNVMKTDYF